MNKLEGKYIINLDTQCWEWIKSLSGSGYGQLTINGRYWSAHRYSYTQSKGEIPDGMLIRHVCNNQKCCNPNHLIIGTNKENYYDTRDRHLRSIQYRRKSWKIGGKKYSTVRAASKESGIHQETIIKYTKNGVFDIPAYQAGCLRARVTPKL